MYCFKVFRAFDKYLLNVYCVQFSLVAQSCLTLCDSMDCSTPGFPVLRYLPEFTQLHVHWLGEAIQPSYPLSPPSLPAFNLSQHQGLFRWVRSSHQVAKVLEFQLQHQSFQWMFRTLGWTGWISLQSKGLSFFSTRSPLCPPFSFSYLPNSESLSVFQTVENT